MGGIKEPVQDARKRCRADLITAKCAVYISYPTHNTSLRFFAVVNYFLDLGRQGTEEK